MIFRLGLILIFLSSLFSFEVEDDSDISTIIEIIESSPINLNRAGSDQIYLIPFITLDDANRVVELRDQLGRFRRVDLLRYGVVDYRQYQLIENCFTLGERMGVDIATKVISPIYQVKGEKGNKFLGGRESINYKTTLRSENLTFGFNGERDSYELSRDRGKYFFGFNGGYFDLAVGNGVLGGNSLLIEGGSFNDPYRDIDQLFRVKPDLSYQELYNMRGGGATLTYQNFSIYLGGFRGRFSGSLVDDRINTIKSDGFFATPNHFPLYHNLSFNRYLSKTQYLMGDHRISLGGIYTDFSRRFYKDSDQDYDKPIYGVDYRFKNSSIQWGISTLIKDLDSYCGKGSLYSRGKVDRSFFIQYSNIKKVTPFSNRLLNLDWDKQISCGLKLSKRGELWYGSLAFSSHYWSGDFKHYMKVHLKRRFKDLNCEFIGTEKISNLGDESYGSHSLKVKIFTKGKIRFGSTFQFSGDQERGSEGIMISPSINLKLSKRYEIKIGGADYFSTKGKNQFYIGSSFESTTTSLNSMSGSGYMAYIRGSYNWFGFKLNLGYYLHSSSSSETLGSGDKEVEGYIERVTLNVRYRWRE